MQAGADFPVPVPAPTHPLQAEQLRRAEEKEELEGLTFRPEISKLAKALKVQEVAHAGGALPACERLYYKSATAKRQVGGSGDGAGQRRQLAPLAAVTAKTQVSQRVWEHVGHGHCRREHEGDNRCR